MKNLNKKFLETILQNARVSDTNKDDVIEAIQLVIDDELAQARYDSFVKWDMPRFMPTLISLKK